MRELSKICGYLEFFIGGVGYDIKFVPELPREKLTAKETPQNDNKPGEGARGYDDEDEDDLYDFEDDLTKKMSGEGEGSALVGQSEQKQPNSQHGQQKGRHGSRVSLGKNNKKVLESSIRKDAMPEGRRGDRRCK